MASDQHGLEVTGSVAAVAAYDRAIDHLLRFQAGVADECATSVAVDPGFTMGHVLGAYLALMSTEGAAATAARDSLGALRTRGDGLVLLPRELAHVAVVERWAAGDMLGAGALLDEITLRFPLDVLALAVGHQIDFFGGSAVNLRDRVARALVAWDPGDPHYGYLLGMHAFGLEECNRYDLSEAIGQQAVHEHPDDVWAIHAVTHTYEMLGRIPDGVRFMRERESDWAQGNFLNVHNSWHYALFLLEGGDTAGALAIYDRVLHNDASGDVALELLDATALLWRLHLEGVSVGTRWRPLSDAWARSLVPGYYPFNDMHAVMSFVGAEDLDRARTAVADLQAVAMSGDPSTLGWATTIAAGLPVCRSLVHFADGDYERTVADLLAVRGQLHELGGSHAQRDAIARTLLEAAIRSRNGDLARGLVGERLGSREASSYSWTKRAELSSAHGDIAAARAATARVTELEAAVKEAAA